MNLNDKYKGRPRTEGVKLKCRGYMLMVHKIPNMPETISRAFFKTATLYFSCNEPIAIRYRNGEGIMLFQKLGDITVQNRLRLREHTHYRTVMEKEFNAALFTLLANM
jgi:hypothetical protein